MSVTVWSKTPCVQCGAVKRALTKGGVEFEEKQLEDHPEQLEAFKAIGLMQAPVVFADGHEPFAGFNPDAVQAIVAQYGVVL